MKPFIVIAVSTILACNSASNNQLPKIDSSDTALKGNTLHNSDAGAHMPKDTTRLSGMWFLEPVLASDTATGKIPRLDFNLSTKHFSGNTGCNNMSGTFVYTDSSLTFNPPVTTKMNCVGYNEKAFLETLLRTNSYRFDNGMLILLFNQTELSRWTRKVAPKPVTNKT